MIIPASIIDRRASTNSLNRTSETIRPSDLSHLRERQFACILADPSVGSDKNYDNHQRSRPNFDTVRVVLKRDKRFLDFGFSISDRLYGTGVYVNKIRPNGPAHQEGTLIPRMRIYKVILNRFNSHDCLNSF